MADERRLVLTELMEMAREHAAGHQALHENAVEHGRDDMANRAYSNWNAWMEVARVLRFELDR